MTECVTSARVTGVPASAHARRGSLACAARGDGRFRSLPSLENGLRRMTTTAPREDACTLRATNRFATPCRHLAAARKKSFSFPPQMNSSRPSEGQMSYSARGDGRRQPSESLTVNGHQETFFFFFFASFRRERKLTFLAPVCVRHGRNRLAVHGGERADGWAIKQQKADDDTRRHCFAAVARAVRRRGRPGSRALCIPRSAYTEAAGE